MPFDVFSDVVNVWLAVAVLFTALEAFGVSGIGFLFGGLAALLVAAGVKWNLIDSDATALQMAAWFGCTTLIAAVLWKPMKRWRTGEGKEGFNNMVGDTVTIVKGDLTKGNIGKAKWSGAVMNAEIDPTSEATSIPQGDAATITQVKGTLLLVVPRS